MRFEFNPDKDKLNIANHGLSLAFAERFTGQWLHIRELSGDKAPDATLFPDFAKDEELRSDIRLQPALFQRFAGRNSSSVICAARSAKNASLFQRPVRTSVYAPYVLVTPSANHSARVRISRV